jgi:perosamine synthetase
MLLLRDQGRLPGDRSFRNVEIAWKYKMSELQAALGRVQLARLDELVARKRQIFGWYKDRLDGLPISLNIERPTDRSTFWMVTAIFAEETGLDSSMVRDALAPEGMVTRPFFPALSSIPAFASSRDTARASQENPVSYALATRGINLPSALMLSEPDVDRVCAAVRSLVASAPGTEHR